MKFEEQNDLILCLVEKGKLHDVAYGRGLKDYVRERFLLQKISHTRMFHNIYTLE